EHDARREDLHRAGHHFERARLVRFVGVDAYRFRTTRFRLTPAHTARYAGGARFGRRRPHDVATPDAFTHDEWPVPQVGVVRTATGCDHRPVRTPHTPRATCTCTHPARACACGTPFPSTRTS